MDLLLIGQQTVAEKPMEKYLRLLKTINGGD